MDILTLDHNFGKEIETSANQLFNFFCNNVNLGQWQIAKTCLKQLIQDKKLLFVNFDSVFSSIIKHPEVYCGASLSIKSPFYFSRLLCQTILEIYPDFLIENSLQDLIELRIIFYSHFDKISNSNCQMKSSMIHQFKIIKDELEEIVNDAKNFDSEIQLKSPTLEFIKNIMFNDVLKAKNLLNLILLKNPNIEYCLIEFHLKLLSESLNTFESNVIKAKDTLNESTSDIFSLINLLLVYQKLNSLTFNSNRKFELIAMTQRFFRNTCFKLREIFSENLQHLELNITKVQLALLDRYKSSPLLELFTKINYEIDRQAIISKSFNDESLVVLSIIKHSLSNKKTDSILWKKLFLFTLVEKRCLVKSLVEECLKLISKNQLDFLTSIFSIREFNFLKPIILLIGISRVKDINSAKKLVNILSSNNSKETLVDQIGNFLKTHLDFVNWFFQQNSQASTNSLKRNQTNETCFKQLMKILHKRLPLNIINDYLNLNKIDHSEITKIICNTLIERDDLIETKCVRFIDEVNEKMCPIQQKSLNVFNGFYCINQILRCILFCCENLNEKLYQNLESKVKTKSNKAKMFKTSEARMDENENIELQLESIKRVYHQNVIQILQNVKLIITKIDSFDYRLEILENIYALIFVTSNDLFKASQDESDQLTDDPENVYNPMILIENAKRNSIDDFEIVEIVDKETDLSIYENSAAGLNQLMPSDALISKNSSDLNFDVKSRRSRRSRHETNREIEDCAHYTYTKNAGGGEHFLANDFLCRDILLVLKECLNSYSSLDCKIDNFQSIFSRSKKLLQLVNETLWRFQLIKPSNVSIDFGQISILKCHSKCMASECEQHLVYQFMKKRQRRDSNISSITNYESIKNENLTLSLNRSFKNSDLKTSHLHRDKRRSLESHRSLSLIYPQSNNKKSNSVVMKLLCDIKTLSVMCLKEFKSNEANQLVKIYSTRQDVANLFEFEQIIFNNIVKESVEAIVQLDCLKSSETIHEQSLLSLNISKIIDNLTQAEKGKPLIQSILICDLVAILKIDMHIVKSLIEFASVNLDQKVSQVNPDLEYLDKQIGNKINVYIDSINALDMTLKKENALRKHFFLDYIIAHDGVSILAKNSDQNVQCIFEKINNYLELTSQIDLCLEELCASEEANLDVVYEKILNQLKSKTEQGFDVLNCFIQKSKKAESSKTNGHDGADTFTDNSEHVQFKKDKYSRSESMCIDSNNNYLMSFNEYTKTLYQYLKENSVQSSLDCNFSILDFSPASLICKLLFDDLLRPESIEPLTQNLNLNLTAIILHNSCPRLKLISCENKSTNLPRIDKLKLMSNVSVYKNEFFYSILNENSVFSCSIKKPHDFVRDLLFNVLRCCQWSKNSSAKSLLQIYSSTDLKKNLKMSQQLQHLNLDYLKTKNEKLSFFINLHNLLSIHANIFLLSLKSNKTKIVKPNTSQSKLLILNDTLALSDTADIYLHKNKTFKMLFEQKMCYKVGQMGCVSLFDLKHFILLKKKNQNLYQSNNFISSENQIYLSPLIEAKNSKKKSIFNRISPLKLSSSPKLLSTDTDNSSNSTKAEQHKKPYQYSLFELDLKMEPLWSRYIPDTLDHRIMFALINCVQSDPPICVFDSDQRLDDQLQMQMKNFLNQTVFADNENEILYVPSLLLENLFCFSDHATDDKLSNFIVPNLEHTNDGLDNLVKFLVDQANAELKENIKKLLNLDSIHCYGENIDQFGRKELPFPIVELKSSAKFCLVRDDDLMTNDKIGWYKNQIEQLQNKQNDVKGLENIQGEREIVCSKKLLNVECLEYISKSSPLILKNLGFLFDIRIRDDFFTAMSEINVKNLIEYEHNINNCKNNYLNRFIQLYVPLDYMSHLNMDLKLDMVTQFLLNSKTEEVKVENIIDLANYYSIKHEWKKVIDLLEDCTQDNEEFYDFRDLTQVNNLEISVQFITEINSLTINSKFIQKDIYNLFDHACLSFANQEAKHFDKSYYYLFKINNFIRQIRAVFGLIDQWSIDGCLELVDFCIKKCQFFQLADLDSNEAQYLSSLIEILDDKKKEFTAYNDLILCAQNVLEKYYEHQQVQDAAGFYDSNNPVSFSSTNELDANYNLLNLNKIKKVCQRCLTWQYAKAHLQRSGDQDDDDETRQLIMDLFLLNDKFVSAKYLIEKFCLDQKLQFKIEFGHLKFRLLNLNAVSSIIEIDLQSILKDCISFSKNNKPQYDLYLFDICFKLINELKDFNDLNNQVLISLSEFLIKNYMHLLNHHQLKELKVIQLTAKMFQILVQDESVYFDSYKRHHSQPILIIEQLLMNAKLDVCAKTIKLSRDYLNDSKLNNDINILLVEYAHKALEFQIYRDIESDNSEQERNKSPNNLRPKMFNKPMSSIINTASSPSTNSILSNFKSKASLFEENSPKANNNFVMPIIPPNKEDWIKDEQVNDCMVCKASRFSLINRRHHCRRCGRVVCGACSQRSTLIQNVARRTCDDCFRQLEIVKENDQIVSTEHEVSTKRTKRKSIVLAQDISHESNDEKMNYYLIGNSINETSLKRDEEVRQNFRYSQAPSTSLCLSILDLHDNSLECGKSLLSLCDDLSLYLQNANQQEDHGLVINMIKYLLQNAKVKLLENSSSNIISLCDSYLSLIDVLEQLLLANCSIIPSLNELMNSESVRRIRNRLLEEERHELAMNLSTKCGLDTQTVWASWGLVELKRSNYKEARTKFEKCLKPLSEKNALNNSANLKILNDILTYFETTAPIRIVKNIKNLLSQPINIESLVSDPKMYPVGTNSLNNIEFEESIFYLETYGSHGLVASFLQRNGFLKNAIEYLVEKKCNAEIFVETILITSLRNGDFFALIELMLNMDKFQNRLYPYYSAIGKFLEKNGFINSLYDFQIQMKDFVRSCMSCIYFFTKNAKMYSDLFSNLHYLNKARKHLEQYLESLSKKQNILPNQSWRLKNDNLRKQMSPQEIDSYINAINLQIECTKFICSYKKETFNDDKPSTLFGNNDAKISLCCQILMAGNSVQEGFGFVIRIIQCFNLSSTLVYTQISRELAKQFNFKEINNLLKCIDESGYKEDKNVTFDECISTCIRVFAAINNENCQNQTSNDTNAFNRHQQVSKYSKEIESLIQLIKSDENKINAFILNGRLKSAYLIAIRLERVDIVKHIANVAERVGQNLIRDICIKWLEKNAK